MSRENNNTENRDIRAQQPECDRHIQLTVVKPVSERSEMNIDLFAIGQGLMRYLALWLALALVVGCVIGGVGILRRGSAYGGNATALIEFSVTSKDITVSNEVSGIQTATVIEQAMTNLDMDVKELDKVREGLSISNVLTSEAYDQMSLYYKAAMDKGNLEAVSEMLKTAGKTNRYMISLNYRNTTLTRDQAVLLLNEILLVYRDSFEKQYNQLPLLGNFAAALDLSKYSFNNSIRIFRNQIRQMEAYLSKRAISGIKTFRSGLTGYKVEDLKDRLSMLRTTDLNTTAAYIYVNSVTAGDAEAEITNYQWQIEEERRALNLATEKFNSLKADIAAYEKDPEVYSTTEGSTTTSTAETTSLDTNLLTNRTGLDAYDNMIADMVVLQDEIAEHNTNIREFESIIERMRQQGSSQEELTVRAREMLTSLTAKVSQLNLDINNTVQEYQDHAVKNNSVNILVTANARSAALTEGNWVKLLLAAEAVLLVVWLVAGIAWGIRSANQRKDTAAA